MFLDTVRIALESLRSNALRSALTLLGMVIGVFSVIASVTAVQVIDDYFTDAFSSFGSTTFFIQKYPAINFGPTDPAIRSRKDITYPQFERLRERAKLPVAVSASETFPEWWSRLSVSYGDRETAPKLQLNGVDQEWVINQGYDIAEGRFLSADDVRYGRPVAVITEPVADELFPYETPLGKPVIVDGRRYQVIGVTEKKGSILGDDQDAIVLAPISTLFETYGGEATRNVGFAVRASSVAAMDATIDEVVGHLRAIRQTPPQNEHDFEIVTNDALSGPFKTFTNYLAIGGGAIGLIALIAAGIGVMNIMLVSVTERTREIGIRKSLGATRRTILTQFLLEAVFLCQVGGVLGIALGVAGGNAMTFVGEGLTPSFPWLWAGIAVVSVTLVALVFGVYPAYKAATLRPVDALRAE